MLTVLAVLMSPVSIMMAASAGLSVLGAMNVSAGSLPSPESVMADYLDNPYIRFYEGSQGMAWTTVHPDASTLSSYGTYVYTDRRYYRGSEGMTVIPQGVVSRKEIQPALKPGQHYYAGEITDSVIPVGKWVLTHREARCIHGPFSACAEYEYYGVNGLPNVKCREEYDSGWVAYCADCGQPITGYIYSDDTCVGKIGYIFAGTDDFAMTYPVRYMFVCPVKGDNLENDHAIGSHMCKCFISYNRYTVRYNGNGAVFGEMPDSVFYYGGSSEYEGCEVCGEESLRENSFINPGYIFAGWSEAPDGSFSLENGCPRKALEDHFTYLSGCGDDVNDTVITLYAVWEKCDSSLLISGGSFRDEPGAYAGAECGEQVEGINLISKGYMYETEAEPSLLSHPRGYRIELDMMGGPEADPIWTDTALTGWSYGNMSGLESMDGHIREVTSDGKVIYVHSSENDGNKDIITAQWESVPVTLPDAVYPGYVFKGWYTAPDLAEEHFVGMGGDLFDTDCDTVLYARFESLMLNAFPDYMGDESFGELRYKGLTDLSLPAASGYDLFRYYISDNVGEAWTEAATDNTGALDEAGEVFYDGAGASSVYTVRRTGIYTLKLWGGAGASYGDYSGENGEYVSCEVLLSEGDVLEIYTGRAGVCEPGEEGVVCEGGESSVIRLNGAPLLIGAGGDGADYVLNVKKEFAFTGSIETYTAEAEGDYTLEVWGARGGAATNGYNSAGNGGYATGTVHLEAGSTLYICAGGKNGYNGGGSGGRDAYGNRGGSGGGATHIAGVSGLLRNLSGSREGIYIVAGGGGGSGGSSASSGTGGGLSGGTGTSPWPGGQGTATGGTQTGAGGGRRGMGSFGCGGSGYSYQDGDYPFITNGGGGGGWYGGGGGTVDNLSYGCGGGGGSGYIGGVENGEMRSGVCGGDGHAMITCSVNITGLEKSGEDTAFYSEGILYRNLTVLSHDESTYPDEDINCHGYCIITEPEISFYADSARTVISPDTSAPSAVTGAWLDLDAESNMVSVFWKMPEDDGTGYSYIARAYRARDMIASDDLYVQTDVKNLCITTGVYGYYFIVDTERTADKESVSGGEFVPSAWARVSGTAPDALFTRWYESASDDDLTCRGFSFVPDGNSRYIHIAAADRAGNIGDVFNMAIDGPEAYIPYPVITEKLVIRESENVFRSPSDPDTYYVRADPSVSFFLEHSSYINGYARRGYQIDEAYFYQSLSEYARYEAAYGNPGVVRESVMLDGPTRTAGFYLIPGSANEAERSGNCARLNLTGEFSLSREGKIFIYPGASAHAEASAYLPDGYERIVSSDADEDVKNGLTLIGDGTPPECYVSVNGGEFERMSACNISNALSEYVIDRRLESVSVEIRITDVSSGAKDGFEIEIYNFDNGMTDTVSVPGSFWRMELKMDEGSKDPAFENMLFNGGFVISVTSEDNVGNIGTESSANICELDVSGSIHRHLDELTGPLVFPAGDVFMKRGESGYVLSDVWGYPDAVLVSFENEKLSEYDTLYIIEGRNTCIPGAETAETVIVPAPEYMFEERTEFTVPLDYDESVIKVRITAYKGGESLTWETQCQMASEGTVLDELITVLR